VINGHTPLVVWFKFLPADVRRPAPPPCLAALSGGLGEPCQPATAGGLRVYPPGQTEAGYVSHRFSACSSGGAALLTILPVRSGKGRPGITP
jgi:hypothetical protein